MSLTATISMSLSPIAARNKFLPIRPKPLIPTLIAMSLSSSSCKQTHECGFESILCGEHVFHVHVLSFPGFADFLTLVLAPFTPVCFHPEVSFRLSGNSGIEAQYLGSRRVCWRGPGRKQIDGRPSPSIPWASTGALHHH